jgi:hypothetical protein
MKPMWARLRVKGGKAHAMPCHHTFETYLHACLEGTGISDEPKGPLFRTVRRGTGQLSTTPLPQANAYATVRRRALAAGIGTRIGNHTFRATGITRTEKRRHARKRRSDGEPRVVTQHAAVRQATRRDQPGRSAQRRSASCMFLTRVECRVYSTIELHKAVYRRVWLEVSIRHADARIADPQQARLTA